MYSSEHSANGMPKNWFISLRRSSGTNRLNTKLEANGYPPMTSLVKDLSDGVRLIQLMVCHNVLFPKSALYSYTQEIMGTSLPIDSRDAH